MLPAAVATASLMSPQVGGIGTMNSLLASVRERAGETRARPVIPAAAIFAPAVGGALSGDRPAGRPALPNPIDALHHE